MATTMGIAPATAHESEASPPTRDGSRAGAPRVRGLLRRMMPRGHYSPQGTAPSGRATEMMSPPAASDGAEEKPRRGWLRRLASQEGAPRRWKSLGGAGASRRLASLSRSLRWKRLSVNLRGGWASALLDTVAFRVMYVLEAVVLGLALSCFFCCCGCQI
ncbi:uncharacterized protein LOC124663396 [Lolium rigidum]|uniref:uncharacterized protein LOC124663396 n=1 Tax=Lolium rigidum TaxID=89674 RepID=UPI001F5C2462|nr:uncharacterized protein LOC124663396 [Lolium rigidum]